MKWLHVLSAFLLLLFNHHASATNVVDSISDSLSTQHLGEVLVLAKSVYRENNHINILPSNRQKRHSDTGYALLRNLMIPGIDIEDDGVIKAKGSVAGVYINGQPAEVRDIQNIHPVDVVRIEYYDMPDGKYSKDVSAINFVLRQYKSGGYVQLSGEQAVNINKGSYNITSSVSKGKNAYSFFTGYEYYSIDDNSFQTDEIYNFADFQIDRYSSFVQQDKKRTGYAQFQFSHQTDKSYWIGKFTFVGIKNPGNKTYGDVSISPCQTNAFMSNAADKSYSPKVDLNANIPAGKNGNLSLGIHARHLNNDNNYSYEESAYHYTIKCNENVNSFNTGAIYTLKYKKSSFTAEMFDYYTHYNTDYIYDVTQNKRLWKNEALIFVSGKFPINNNIYFSSRLGGDYYQYHLTGSKQFRQLTPRVNLKASYQLHNSALQWSFMYVNSNYDMATINNTPVSVNQYLIRQGNPNIRKSHDIENSIYYSWQYKILNMAAIMQYSYSHNPVSYSYEREGRTIIQTFANDGHNQDLLAMLAASIRLPNSFSIISSLSYQKTDISLSEHWSHNNFTANIRLQWFNKSWSFMSGINFAKSELNKYSLEVVKQPFNYNFKVSYSKDNLLISFNAFAPFYNRHIRKEILSEYYEEQRDILNHRLYNYYNLSIAYTFNFGKRIPFTQKNIDERVDSSILHNN